MELNKYNSSKIYKITSPHTHLIYIGSTINKLKKRFYNHISICNKTKSKYITQLGDAEIELIEEYNCNNRKELARREGEHIRANLENCLNKNIAGRGIYEYVKDNREKITNQTREYRKQYYAKKRLFPKNDNDIN